MRVTEFSYDQGQLQQTADNLGTLDLAVLRADRITAIKAEAARLIADIEGDNLWRLRRAEQRGGADMHRVYFDLDHIRTLSDAAEAAVAALDERSAIHGFNIEDAFAPTRDPRPVPLTKVGFMNLVAPTLGDGPAGAVAYETALAAVRDSADPGVQFAYAQFLEAVELERDVVAVFLSTLVQYQIGGLDSVTTDQIINTWPLA